MIGIFGDELEPEPEPWLDPGEDEGDGSEPTVENTVCTSAVSVSITCFTQHRTDGLGW